MALKRLEQGAAQHLTPPKICNAISCWYFVTWKYVDQSGEQDLCKCAETQMGK